MYLIIGLGNPGPRYELTRHNVGFQVVDNLAEKHGIKMDTLQSHSLLGRGMINGCEVVLAKPMTYMNESGKAVRSLTKGFDVAPEQVMVVHDDIDLPLGKIKRKTSGGAAGQRGLESIIQKLGTDRFTRFRIGIGRPENKDDIVDYVLSPFGDDEWPELNRIIEDAVQWIEATLTEFNTPTKHTEEQPE